MTGFHRTLRSFIEHLYLDFVSTPPEITPKTGRLTFGFPSQIAIVRNSLQLQMQYSVSFVHQLWQRFLLLLEINVSAELQLFAAHVSKVDMFHTFPGKVTIMLKNGVEPTKLIERGFFYPVVFEILGNKVGKSEKLLEIP